jgi:hypothetical protein
MEWTNKSLGRRRSNMKRSIRYAAPGEYNLYERNCNYVVQDILSTVGLNFSDTSGDAGDERELFDVSSLLPPSSGVERFGGALVEDIADGTIPRAVSGYATTLGEVPNARLIGPIIQRSGSEE